MTIAPDKAKRMLRKAVESQDEQFYKRTIGVVANYYDVETVIAWVTEDVLPEVNGDAMMWAYRLMLSEDDLADLDYEAKAYMVKTLTERGYQLGIDFSFTEFNTMVATSEIADKLIEDIPEKHREYFRSKIHKADANDPRALLEKHLGVPFVDNLVQIVADQIPTMDDEELGIY